MFDPDQFDRAFRKGVDRDCLRSIVRLSWETSVRMPQSSSIGMSLVGGRTRCKDPGRAEVAVEVASKRMRVANHPANRSPKPSSRMSGSQVMSRSLWLCPLPFLLLFQIPPLLLFPRPPLFFLPFPRFELVDFFVQHDFLLHQVCAIRLEFSDLLQGCCFLCLLFLLNQTQISAIASQT